MTKQKTGFPALKKTIGLCGHLRLLFFAHLSWPLIGELSPSDSDIP